VWKPGIHGSVLSFFLPLGAQIRLLAAGNLPIIGISAALLAGFMGLFVHYQEHFCKKGCPYALIQLLLQSDRTRCMEFANPDKTCTNCRDCINEIACPAFYLDDDHPVINEDMCIGCAVCSQICTEKAIRPMKKGGSS